MTKKDLVRNIAEKQQLTQGQVTQVLDGLIEEIYTSLEKGEKVALPGFGTFDLSVRKARVGRNPSTGDAVNIAEKTVPRFSAGKQLKEAAAKAPRQ